MFDRHALAKSIVQKNQSLRRRTLISVVFACFSLVATQWVMAQSWW